jgi:hypothetical protein
MKKIVKLTESDLNRIVKRVMNEGVTTSIVVNADQDFPHMMNQKGTWVADQNEIKFYDQANQPVLTLVPGK